MSSHQLSQQLSQRDGPIEKGYDEAALFNYRKMTAAEEELEMSQTETTDIDLNKIDGLQANHLNAPSMSCVSPQLPAQHGKDSYKPFQYLARGNEKI